MILISKVPVAKNFWHRISKLTLIIEEVEIYVIKDNSNIKTTMIIVIIHKSKIIFSILTLLFLYMSKTYN